MAILSLGAINKKILIAVFGGLFKLVANIILYHSEVKMKTHPCILGINAGIGLSLSFFPYIYLLFLNCKTFKFDSNNDYLIYNDTLHKINDLKRKKRICYILEIAILDFLQKFLTFFFVDFYVENLWIFDSLLILIFSYFILKTKIYRHHFISLIMIIIIGIILIIINSYDKEVNFLDFFITLLTEVFYSLENVICKLATDVKFSSPYQVCFWVGFFELIIFISLLIFFTNFPISGIKYMNNFNDDYIDNYYSYIDILDYKEIFIFILSMFTRCVFILFGFIITNYFTPAHIVLILIIGEVSFLFVEDYNWKLYLKIIFFIILLICILIFVEILELNIFGLQQNTKKNIINRSKNEESKFINRFSSVSDCSDNNEEELSRKNSNIQMGILNNEKEEE